MKTLSAILALTLAALLLGAGCSSNGQDSSGAAAAPDEATPAKGMPDEIGGGEDIAVVAPGVPSIDTKVIQTASLRLVLTRGDFDAAVGEARTLAASMGGFVVSSETSQARAGKPVRGSLVVRVPDRSYAKAMRALEGLGRVEGREETGTDVSSEYVDLSARARHLEAVERQLLELLDRAKSVQAALAVQSTLNETQLQLEETRGRLRYLDDQTAYATITLSLRERAAVVASTGGWGIVNAWQDGAQAFVAAAAWVFVAVAIVAPLALLLGAVFLAVWFSRRHRRFRPAS
jgi:hypothetical protein